MSTTGPPIRTVAGAMTGTSLDAIDVAVVSIGGRGLDLETTLVRGTSLGLGNLAGELRRAAAGEPLSAETFCALAYDLGERYAGTIASCLRPDDRLDLVAAHGQTIVHRPPLSWQLLNPAPIAARFECPVVCDLRQADLACGGQGAPITPLADWVLFRDSRTRAVVNLGGFCNVTVLPAGAGPEAVSGYDVCVCNHVLDEVARRALGAPYDRDGLAAARGHADDAAVAALRATLERQHAAGRSLGSGDEAGEWVQDHVERLDADDLAASVCEAIAQTIGTALAPHSVQEIVVAGGGACNRALVAAITEACAPTDVRRSDELGVPAPLREAQAMAVLGSLAADGIPVALPQVTGASRALPAGLWWLPAQEG
ncbi:MAG: anhydro-N-acetylmuramic acid kinase [Planctomycetota bacterium]|jgi:1,6-anhydro-N-acetylmuramate kinase